MSARGPLEKLRAAWGATRAYVVSHGVADDLRARLASQAFVVRVSPLGGTPVSCQDLRERGAMARAAGETLVLDDELCGPWACAALRLGAHVGFAPLGERCLVGLSRDMAQRRDGFVSVFDGVSAEPPDELTWLDDAMSQARESWRRRSDTAAVVASYLRCHPRVDELRYPGLKEDPSFSIAARMLEGGFGPLVDYRLEASGPWKRLVCPPVDPKNLIRELERELS